MQNNQENNLSDDHGEKDCQSPTQICSSPQHLDLKPMTQSKSTATSSAMRWFAPTSILSRNSDTSSSITGSASHGIARIKKTHSTGGLWNALLFKQTIDETEEPGSSDMTNMETLSSSSGGKGWIASFKSRRKSLPWSSGIPKRYKRSRSDTALSQMQKHQQMNPILHDRKDYVPLIPSHEFDSCLFLMPLLSLQENNQEKETSQNCATFHHLPREVLVIIAMKCGFRSACQLRIANKFMYSLLSDPSSWRNYSIYSHDSIDITLTIMTRLHTFDHLIFGEWDYIHTTFQSVLKYEQEKSQRRRQQQKQIGSLSPTSTVGGDYGTVFFLHKTFLEHYDYLGGVSFSMQGDGSVDIEFFEHRERLPCYETDILGRIDRGEIPPPFIAQSLNQTDQRREIEQVLHQVWEDRHQVEPQLSPENHSQQQHRQPIEILSRSQDLVTGEESTPLSHSRSSSSSSIGGIRIPHSCHDCAHYDDMVVLESMFVFDQVPHRPDWFQSGFHYVHSFPSSPIAESHYEHGRRPRRMAGTVNGRPIPVPAMTSSTSCSLTICVKPCKRGMFMGMGDDDLPMVSFHVPKINGVALSEKEYQLFRKLVQHR